jgi:hypothetical protein
VAEWGHIKLSRKFFEHDPYWNEARARTKAEAWIDCIQMASWKPRKYAIGQAVEELGRGEFQASVRFLAKRWRWGKHVVEKFLEGAKKGGRLTVQREGQGGTVYLLVNYEAYQGDKERRGTPRGTGKGTPRGHLGDKTEAIQAIQTEKIGTNGHTNGRPDTWLTPFAQTWEKRAGKFPYGKAAKPLRELVDQYGEPQVLDRWLRYLTDNDPKYWSVNRFCETYHRWDASVKTNERPDVKDEPQLEWVD